MLVLGLVLGCMHVSLVRANCGQDDSGGWRGALSPGLREDQDAESEALKMIRSGVTQESRHACRPGQETG